MPSSPICAWAFVRPPSSPPVYPARSSASLSARVSSPAPGAKHADFAWGFALLWFGMACIVATAEACWCDPTWPLRDELYAASLSFTACACIPAVAGFLADAHLIDDGDSETHGTLLSATLFILIVVTSATQRSAKSGNRAASPAQVAPKCSPLSLARSRSRGGAPMCRPVRGDDDRKHGRDDRRANSQMVRVGGGFMGDGGGGAGAGRTAVREGLEGLAGSGPLAAALGWAAQVVAWGAMGAQHESGRKMGMEVVDGACETRLTIAQWDGGAGKEGQPGAKAAVGK